MAFFVVTDIFLLPGITRAHSVRDAEMPRQSNPVVILRGGAAAEVPEPLAADLV